MLSNRVQGAGLVTHPRARRNAEARGNNPQIIPVFEQLLRRDAATAGDPQMVLMRRRVVRVNRSDVVVNLTNDRSHVTIQLEGLKESAVFVAAD